MSSENLEYVQALTTMIRAFRHLEERVSPPVQVQFKDHFVFRYSEKTIQQAILQKLARLITGLQSTHLLMQAGFLQEQGALQRILDELQEDATFLSLALIQEDVTELHEKFLDYFYREEFNPQNGEHLAADRPTIPRKKIRAYIARCTFAAPDPSSADKVARIISKGYSGFVHAASPHVMDLVAGDPPEFQLSGQAGSLKQQYKQDVWNYFYRSLIAFAMAARAFSDEPLFQSVYAETKRFAESGGKEYFPG